MIINPLAIYKYDNSMQDEGKITEIIEELINRKPDIVLDTTEPYILSNDIQQIMLDKKVKGISIQTVLDNMFGYGKCEPYLKDENLTDIVINNKDVSYIRKFGKWQDAPIKFNSEGELREFIKRIVIKNGEKIDENAAEVVCSDRERGLRIVAGFKPLMVESPILSVRKPATNQTLEELEEQGVITNNEVEIFKKAVKNRKAIVIVGQGGSGKTTLLGALLKEIPEGERFLLIQESYEIKCDHKNCISQLVRVTDNPYRKDYTLYDLTKFGLLLSLDRMIIGEIKDKEMFDFTNAIFTGHMGSMATLHAPSADKAIQRMLLLMQRADTNLTEKYLEELLRSSIDIIVYMEDFKVQEIMELS